MADANGAYSSDRLDRTERMAEALAKTHVEKANRQAAMQQDVNNLYVSRVVMGEPLTKFGEAQENRREPSES